MNSSRPALIAESFVVTSSPLMMAPGVDQRFSPQLSLFSNDAS